VQNAVNYVKVAALELRHELGNQIGPLAGKIFVPDVADGIA